MNGDAQTIDPLGSSRQTVGRRDSAEWWGGEFRVKQVVTSWGASGAALGRFYSEHAPAGRTPWLHPSASEALRLARIGTVMSRRAHLNCFEQRTDQAGVASRGSRGGNACRATVSAVRRYRRGGAAELSSYSDVESRMRFSHSQCERMASRRGSVRSDSQGGFAVTSARGGHIF